MATCMEVRLIVTLFLCHHHQAWDLSERGWGSIITSSEKDKTFSGSTHASPPQDPKQFTWETKTWTNEHKTKATFSCVSMLCIWVTLVLRERENMFACFCLQFLFFIEVRTFADHIISSLVSRMRLKTFIIVFCALVAYHCSAGSMENQHHLVRSRIRQLKYWVTWTLSRRWLIVQSWLEAWSRIYHPRHHLWLYLVALKVKVSSHSPLSME